MKYGSWVFIWSNVLRPKCKFNEYGPGDSTKNPTQRRNSEIMKKNRLGFVFVSAASMVVGAAAAPKGRDAS